MTRFCSTAERLVFLVLFVLPAVVFPLRLYALDGFFLAEDAKYDGRLAFTAIVKDDKKIVVVDFVSRKFRMLVDSKGNDWYPGFQRELFQRATS